MTNGLGTCKCADTKYLKKDYSACGDCGDKANCDGTMTITCKAAG